MRIRTFVIAGVIAVAAAVTGVASANAHQSTVTSADCIWNHGNPICYPNQ